MPLLSRRAGKLLGTVGGMKHAGDEDHEEPIAKRRQIPAKQNPQDEEDINAEPESTDEELNTPQPRAPRPHITLAPSAPEPDELRKPQRKVPSKVQNVRPASPQEEELRQPRKSNRTLDNNKKNNSAASSQSSLRSTQDNPFDFGMEYASQGSNKSKKVAKFGGGIKNIHAAPPKAAPPKRKAPAISVPRQDRTIFKQASKAGPTVESGDSDSEVSMLDQDELDDVLKSSSSQPVPVVRQNMLEDKELRQTSRRAKPTVLHGQLGDWMQDRAPESSQPDSSAPKEECGDLESYLEQLPKEEEEGSQCPICRTPVQKDDYWDYWKGKNRTVKNQNQFCRSHRTKSAQEEYRKEFPEIVWDDLPQRIKKRRMDLYKILHNEQSSTYRDRYEPIALTGRAAAVPSRRKDLPEHVQQELESHALDDLSTYPGYYGPHGRRLITETVMKVLKNEIKKCADPVVQGSGPATFVQAVLVPEVAIMLIMEDCLVDRQAAEEIREKTYELGMLLNEEIEDSIEGHEQSDDENEYGGR
ncbi:telomere capping restricting protein 4 [Parastagonospora nodorum]|nr:telomere capping restricting protein 4 [Parastagonospora nodorum]KAH6320101.1 telomere capping restricting protein 4 [Parastagonospora nodorum]